MPANRELTPMDIIRNAAFADGLRDSVTRVPPRTQQQVVAGTVAVRSRGEPSTLKAIMAQTGMGKNTVLRAIRIMEREHAGDDPKLRLYPLIFTDRGIRQHTGEHKGKQAANHYRPNWTSLGQLCDDEALTLFARQLAAADAGDDSRSPVLQSSAVAIAQGSVGMLQGSVTELCGAPSGFRTEPCEVSQGSVTEPCFDPELDALQKLFRERRAEAEQQLARETPPLAGEVLRMRRADLARPMRERSNVPNVPPSLAQQDVLERSSGNVVKVSDRGSVGNVACEDPRRAALRQEIDELRRRLGEPSQLLTAVSLALAWLDGPLTESAYRSIIESASQHRPVARWKIACGALKRQLAELPAATVKAAGFWGIDAAHDRPTAQLRIRDAKQRLGRLGIAWNPKWAGRARKPSPREADDKPP